MLSGTFVVEHLGLSPFPPMTHPVWGFFLRVLNLLPGSLVVKGNVFNAACMGLASGLLCSLMQAWHWLYMPEKYRHNPHEQAVSRCTGVLASIVFTVSLPGWVAGTRIMPLSLDVAGMMLALWLLWRFYCVPSVWFAALIPLLWGIGITEYGTFAVLTPVVAPLFILLLWRSRLLRPRYVLLSAACGLAGCSVYLWSALAYMYSPAYTWREFEGLYQVFWYLWRDQYLELKKGMVSVGWLLVFTMLIVPWLTLLFLPATQQRKSRYQAPSWFLFLVFGLMAGIILLNIPPAPWVFSGIYPLLVLPYLFFAAWSARLAGTIGFVLTAGDTARPGLVRIKQALLVLLCGALSVFLGVVAVRNYRIVNPSPLADIDVLAGQMVESLPEDSFVISNGLMDQSLILAAHMRGKTTTVINLPFCISKSYRRYIASLFEDARLQNLAIIGWQPFMEEWSRKDADFPRRVRILQPPDLWSRLGCTPVPQPTLYAGMDPQNPFDAATLKSVAACCLKQAAAWTRRVPPENLGAGWYGTVKTLLSQVNNNLGVVLEDQALPEDAAALYESSLRLDDQNICALMNRLSILQRANAPEADALKKQLEEMAAAQKQRISFWQLSARYGYIRDPGFYMAQGYAWAVSGKPSAAIQEVRRAIDLSGETPAMKTLLAQLYVNADEQAVGEEIYQTMLEEDPANPRALAGLAHLALIQRNPEEARRYLDRLRELDVPETTDIQEGILMALAAYSDDYKGTREMVRGMLKKNPGNTRLWATLALLANENNDEATVREAQTVLENAVKENPMLALALAQLNLRSGDYEQAKQNLIRSIRLRPAEMALHEQLVQLLVNLRQRDEAEEECRVILGLDRNNAIANYVIGTIQASRGEDALAENSYRASIAERRSPLALNDLAWLLVQRGRGDSAEALALIDEAARLDPENPNTMDTYGYILLKQNRLDESERRLRGALTRQPDNPNMLLHLAELYEKQGRFDEAYQLAEPLLERMSEMTDADYQTLRELVHRTRKGSRQQL